MIEARGLTRTFAGVPAVDGVTFTISSGEVVGFLGPNGAGKSTTLRMLTGYLAPTGGTAQVAGWDVVRQGLKVRRAVGYMPESAALYPEMRVSEYLRFRARLKGVRRAERTGAIAAVMERCFVDDVRRKTIQTLSKGYRQRVALADALLGDPQVLILDEPTAGLDPNQVRQVRDLVRELGRDHTLLLSTHILSEVEAVCDRALVLSGGRLVRDVRLDDLGDIRGVELEVSGPDRGALESVFAGLDGVRGVDLEDLGEGWVRAHVTHEPGADLRRPVAEAVRGAGGEIRELHARRTSLEELFVEATQRDTGTPESPGEAA